MRLSTIISFALGIAVGFGSYYVYDFKRAVGQEILVAGIQGKVDAALTICPAAFKNIVATEKKKE